MYAVVNEGGTGRAAYAQSEVCGKTGTAQVASSKLTKGGREKAMQNNAWFVAYGPMKSRKLS